MLSIDTIPKINISNRVNISLGCSIIPILLTHIEKKSLINHLAKYIEIPDTYNSLLKHIEDNMKNNNLHMVSLTIETPIKKQTKTQKQTQKQTQTNLIVKSNNKTTKNNNKTLNDSKIHDIKIPNTKLPNNNHIHQLFIISVNDRNYNKENDYELLEIARISGNASFNILKTNQIGYTNIIDTVSNKNTKFIQCLIEGLLLSAYKFLKYKTAFSLTKSKDKYKLNMINVVIPSKINIIKNNIDKHNIDKHNITSVTKEITTLQNQVKTVFLARDLINEPANESKVTQFIKIVKEFIKENKIPVILEVLEKNDLEKLGMGLILGVGKGSSPENSPKVIIIKYNGNQSNGKSKKLHPEYVLMGKGITFDTGGLDLKGSKSMLEMKTDLSGAATVISFILGYAMSKGNKSIYTICPFAENSIGPNSTKPSDVIKSYSGRTVEIANTDAEGRLVLADCLSYAVDKYPNASIIDFATLTGQQESVSGKLFSCILYVNSDKDVDKLIEKGKEINEPLVELPLIEKSVDNLESYVADIKNMSFTNSADIIMSALFMRQFIKKDTKWIHIDIAGPSYKVDKVIKYASPEASGVGVRLLYSFFE